MTTCRLCDGECEGADLAPLLAESLLWLWQQAARAADRRGDPVLTHGTLSIKAPPSPEQRAAVLGLVPGRPLAAGQGRRIDLIDLSAAVRRRGPALTPGAVAAHAVGRQLAARARRLHDRHQFEQHLAAIGGAWAASSCSQPAVKWESTLSALRTAGWIAKLQAADDPDWLMQQAFAVIDGLPEAGTRLDRRILATTVTHNPHALDDGQPLPALVLAILAAAGVTSSVQRPRQAWAAVSVDCDDLTGGLIAVGIYPDGWHLPAGAAVTLPPRELAVVQWPICPSQGAWIFVTENPSVASAAAGLAQSGTVLRLLCMAGTPSALEVSAIARLSAADWHVAVRADFDAAGIAHVSAVLRAAPSATPWRMHARDYRESIHAGATVPVADVPDTLWEPDLALAMRSSKLAAFEEALMPALLADLNCGKPPGRD
jgi:uncharacterized protein (TIGR02679 family)